MDRASSDSENLSLQINTLKNFRLGTLITCPLSPQIVYQVTNCYIL